MGNKQTIKGYQLLEQIGEGGFGKVFKAVKNGKVYAIKMISINHKKQTQTKIMDEIQIMKSLKSKYTVEIIESFVEPEPVNLAYIVMQKCENSLDEIFQRIESEDTKLKITKSIVEGVQFIHSQNYIHRDLKMQNILKQKDRILISDFGLSRAVPEQGQMTTIVGSNFYKAKQLITGKKYTHKVDSWALGIILLELWSGERINSLRKGFPASCEDFPTDEEIGKIKNPKMEEIVRKLLVHDQNQRAKVTQIYKMLELNDALTEQQEQALAISLLEVQIERQVSDVKQFAQSQIFIEHENYSDDE